MPVVQSYFRECRNLDLFVVVVVIVVVETTFHA